MERRRVPTTTTLVRRFRPASRQAWWAARARNVLNRRHRLTGSFLPLAAAIFAALFVLPVGVRAVWERAQLPQPDLRDTASLILAERAARESLAAADTELERVRALRDSTDSLAAPRFTSTRADSLSASITLLERLIRRSTNAPLPESYRALGEARPLRGDARIRALLDSLSDVEREREEFGPGAAVDPLYVALTTRANALGRSIVLIAERIRLELRRELTASQIPVDTTSADTTARPDTAAVLARRDSVAQVLRRTMQELAEATRANARARAVDEASRTSGQLAPAPVLIATSTIMALVVIFAVALGDELRAPRVADGVEAERLSDARVLSVVRPRVVPTDRMRRATDRARPTMLDPQLDAYRMLAWHVSAHSPRDGILVVTGEASAISATIAANIAAVLANEARATLLVDIDFGSPLLSAILGIPTGPGIAAVLENRRRWSETVVQVTAGRGRWLDAIPTGTRTRALGPAECEALGSEIRRAGHRYDLTIVHAPVSLARRVLPGADAMVCATLSRTRLSTLARTAAGLRDDGARVLGVALWEGDDVRVRARASRRPHLFGGSKRSSDAA